MTTEICLLVFIYMYIVLIWISYCVSWYARLVLKYDCTVCIWLTIEIRIWWHCLCIITQKRLINTILNKAYFLWLNWPCNLNTVDTDAIPVQLYNGTRFVYTIMYFIMWLCKLLFWWCIFPACLFTGSGCMLFLITANINLKLLS